jgi:hypothetical protein
MNVSVLPDVDITPLDELMFRSDGLLNIVPSKRLKEFPHSTLQMWCVKRAVYQYPTEELIDFLRQQIAGRRAIEVCAGNGAIGRALGIPMTDSYMQLIPAIRAYYKALKQAVIAPPPDVQKFTANEAVKHFKPEVVIGAWVTELYQEGKSDGSEFGVDEMEILKSVKTYIHVGNDKSHGYKQSMRESHQHNRFDWLVSRGQDQAKNHLALWNKS